MQENNKHNDIPNDDELLQYLQGNLTPEEANALEQEMAESNFVNDAMEGLQSFKNKTEITNYTTELKRQLKKQISTKKSRREKRKFKNNNIAIVAVAVILLLCIVAYLVIYYFRMKN